MRAARFPRPRPTTGAPGLCLRREPEPAHGVNQNAVSHGAEGKGNDPLISNLHPGHLRQGAPMAKLWREIGWKSLYPHGATGLDPKLATAEAGERLIDAAVKY